MTVFLREYVPWVVNNVEFVPVPPTLNKFTVGESLRLGQRVSMLCSVVDGDLPLTLSWFRDGRLLRPGLQGGVSVAQIGNFESVLRIDNLRPEHNANFTCRAENQAGEAAHSQALRVKGQSKSRIFVQHQQHQRSTYSVEMTISVPFFSGGKAAHCTRGKKCCTQDPDPPLLQPPKVAF